jgi:LPPG:FO 2-phospho-L-lactate transferase
VNVVALAGGVGAGKFLRGLVRAVRPENVTMVVNTGDDIEVHGLHVAPDIDSVMYWLAGVMDRERGWGRAGETFRATEELGRLGAEGAWFGLGDLDLATHLLRTSRLRAGQGLAEVTQELCARFGVRARVLPMTEEPAPTTIAVADGAGGAVDVHFQEYWVERGGRDEVKAVRYGGTAARPGPGVLDAIAGADTIVLPPTNPIASIAPILAVPGIREAVTARRDRVVGVSGIVGGAPLAGMADKLLPVAGAEVSAAGVAGYYGDLLAAWVIDRADEGLAARVEALGIAVGVTDTIMANDLRAEALARYALSLL